MVAFLSRIYTKKSHLTSQILSRVIILTIQTLTLGLQIRRKRKGVHVGSLNRRTWLFRICKTNPGCPWCVCQGVDSPRIFCSRYGCGTFFWQFLLIYLLHRREIIDTFTTHLFLNANTQNGGDENVCEIKGKRKQWCDPFLTAHVCCLLQWRQIWIKRAKSYFASNA